MTLEEKADMPKLIKRNNFNPTDNELARLLESNSLGRAGDIREMNRLLHSIDGGLSIFLDADWGQGKTYFVRMLQLSINQTDRFNRDNIATIADNASPDINTEDFLPIYFNAWENDYWTDPLSSLAVTLASHSDNVTFTADPSDSNAIAELLDLAASLTNSPFFKVAKTLNSTLRGKDLLEEIQLRTQLRNKIKDAVDALLTERANKLLLIIDELDRCRPDYAVRLLEELKALFELDNVVVLYAVNTRQLSKAVEGIYGAGFDGTGYLSRFYDIKINLRVISPSDYLLSKDIYEDQTYEPVVRELVKHHGFSLRGINQFLELCQDHFNKFRMSPHPSKWEVFALCYIAPILKALSIVNPEGYARAVYQGDPTPLVEEIEGSEFLTAAGNRLLGVAHKKDAENHSILDFVSLFCICLWGKKNDREKWSVAHNTLMDNWDSETRMFLQYAETVKW